MPFEIHLSLQMEALISSLKSKRATSLEFIVRNDHAQPSWTWWLARLREQDPLGCLAAEVMPGVPEV